jgi:hypothetical protein
MKIRHLIAEIMLTNEEKKFTQKHSATVSLNGLDDREHWVAQNLVRKGVYEVSKDSQVLVKK